MMYISSRLGIGFRVERFIALMRRVSMLRAQGSSGLAVDDGSLAAVDFGMVAHIVWEDSLSVK